MLTPILDLIDYDLWKNPSIFLIDPMFYVLLDVCIWSFRLLCTVLKPETGWHGRRPASSRCEEYLGRSWDPLVTALPHNSHMYIYIYTYITIYIYIYVYIYVLDPS